MQNSDGSVLSAAQDDAGEFCMALRITEALHSFPHIQIPIKQI
jgi:hypothetical protein